MPLLDEIIRPTLPEGKYSIRINSFKELHKDTSAKGEPLDYIQLDTTFPDGRNVKMNFFKGNLGYLGSALRKQLGLATEQENMSLGTILEKARNSDKIWVYVSYNEYGMNTAFHEKVVESSEEIKA